MERAAVTTWLNPLFLEAGQAARDEKTAVDATIQAASGLGFVDLSQRGMIQLLLEDLPTDFLGLSDIVHDRLAQLDSDAADSVLLEAFAWQAVQVEVEGGTGWIEDWSADEFAHRADVALCPPGWSGERRFNSTKRAPWRRWIEFVGLQTGLPSNDSYPYITTRFERQLLRGKLPPGVEISADQLLSAVVTELPYLDGGKLFLKYAERVGLTVRPKAVSQLLSAALRDLQEEGKLTLIVRGDSSNNYELAHDPFSKWRSFSAVKIKSESVE
jgi:hypothetical protein